MNLAPHDWELVEADAAAAYEAHRADLRLNLYRRPAWEDAPDWLREVYLKHAGNPYGDGPLGA